MIARITKLINRFYPQNFLLQKPLIGGVIFLIFCYLFLILYKPLNTHGAQSLSYALTMAIYFLVSSAFVTCVMVMLKRFRLFHDKEKWTLGKELLSILIILSVMGVVIYFLGFFIEVPASRWNLRTFSNSVLSSILIGIIPFGIFTLSNYRHLFVVETVQNYGSTSSSQTSEEIIQISSTLKKEELSFYPSQFVYAESDGNYVVFYLTDNQHTRKEIIRNSISNIEQQLSKIPYIIRTHRAFIVNLKRVQSKKGNTLGYQLNLDGADSVIPVSRQHIHLIDELLNQYR